jgi:predicted nucleic acid-binding protein
VILYLDTSAFIKLYVDEAGSTLVRSRVKTAKAVCAHSITYVELRAGLARTQRMARLTREDLSNAVRRLEQDWRALHVVGVDQRLIRRAGNLAEIHGLRAYDSVHLAAAERIHRELWPEVSFGFAVFDGDLKEAAGALEIPIVP